MKQGLIARIERLESKQWAPGSAIHGYIQEMGESSEAARDRYERASGKRIAQDDLVIIRRIVAPQPWGAQ